MSGWRRRRSGGLTPSPAAASSTRQHHHHRHRREHVRPRRQPLRRELEAGRRAARGRAPADREAVDRLGAPRSRSSPSRPAQYACQPFDQLSASTSHAGPASASRTPSRLPFQPSPESCTRAAGGRGEPVAAPPRRAARGRRGRPSPGGAETVDAPAGSATRRQPRRRSGRPESSCWSVPLTPGRHTGHGDRSAAESERPAPGAAAGAAWPIPMTSPIATLRSRRSGSRAGTVARISRRNWRPVSGRGSATSPSGPTSALTGSPPSAAIRTRAGPLCSAGPG